VSLRTRLRLVYLVAAAVRYGPTHKSLGAFPDHGERKSQRHLRESSNNFAASQYANAAYWRLVSSWMVWTIDTRMFRATIKVLDAAPVRNNRAVPVGFQVQKN
jgi:hypothetical protein